jgi:hypothetical protein
MRSLKSRLWQLVNASCIHCSMIVLYEMCAILCDLYNARTVEQMAVISFMAELCGLLSYIDSLFQKSLALDYLGWRFV